MPVWSVNYKVYDNNINESGTWTSSGPSDYTVEVTAFNQVIAQLMVINSNGGPNHCRVLSCRMIG